MNVWEQSSHEIQMQLSKVMILMRYLDVDESKSIHRNLGEDKQNLYPPGSQRITLFLGWEACWRPLNPATYVPPSQNLRVDNSPWISGIHTRRVTFRLFEYQGNQSCNALEIKFHFVFILIAAAF